MNMIERACKAARDEAETGLDGYGGDYVSNWPEVIRAVLKELRVPDEGMLRQVEKHYGGTDSYEMWCDLGFDKSTINTWQAMIDKALEQ